MAWQTTITYSRRCAAVGVEEAMKPVSPEGNGWEPFGVVIVWNDTFAFYWKRFRGKRKETT